MIRVRPPVAGALGVIGVSGRASHKRGAKFIDNNGVRYFDQDGSGRQRR